MASTNRLTFTSRAALAHKKKEKKEDRLIYSITIIIIIETFSSLCKLITVPVCIDEGELCVCLCKHHHHFPV